MVVSAAAKPRLSIAIGLAGFARLIGGPCMVMWPARVIRLKTQDLAQAPTACARLVSFGLPWSTPALAAKTMASPKDFLTTGSGLAGPCKFWMKAEWEWFSSLNSSAPSAARWRCRRSRRCPEDHNPLARRYLHANSTARTSSPNPQRPHASDGLHLIRVVDNHGRTAERDVTVQWTSGY
jgi:hypothetical protein